MADIKEFEKITDKMMAVRPKKCVSRMRTEYRDLIGSVQKIGERRKITDQLREEDKDLIAVAHGKCGSRMQ